MNCPKCKTNLKENGIQAREEGVVVWFNLFINKDGFLEYNKVDENNYCPQIYFQCADCGEDLDIKEKEVIKILK